MVHPRSAKALCAALEGDLDDRLGREWLLTNGRGSFAMGTVAGCPTRRYHALLTAARRPPLERVNALAGIAESVSIGDATYQLWAGETAGGLTGDGFSYLHDFCYDNAPPQPWVEWRYRTPAGDVRKRLTLNAGSELLTVSYEVSATDDVEIRLELMPQFVLRDFHGTRSVIDPPDWQVSASDALLWVADRADPGINLAVAPQALRCSAAVQFEARREVTVPRVYRVETFRGFDEPEPLISEGTFVSTGRRRLQVVLAAGAFFESPADAAEVLTSVPIDKAPSANGAAASPQARTLRRLTSAADQFIAHRASAGHHGQATILAGFPWFGDWGRDAFIAMEGLLLCTKRLDEAREVLATFAGAQRNGLIPNLFDDYGGDCHYNSVDASLWYIHAADRYLSVSGDRAAWRDFLAAACRQVIDAFCAGTDFNIGADRAGLIHCGHKDVQITWMDAKCGDVVFTPRHGRPVEVNALWYHALCIAARRFADRDADFAKRCTDLAKRCRRAFREVFLRSDGLGLNDVVRDDFVDAAVRPNQIFAVSLDDSPLTPDEQRQVLDVVTDKLLTPFGLRSLAPDDPAYRGRFGGDQYARDAAYHQGTVWSWLIGPYIEAYLRVHGFSVEAKAHCRRQIEPLLAHLDEAGLGSVSENFEGDAPHAPRGCIAQAWSVAELIRIFALLENPAVSG